MSKNTGTLITSAIRPNSTDDLIASAHDNELKGTLHTYTSTGGRDAIIEARRSWGMLCAVTSGVSVGTYQLKYGQNSTTITDNANWVLFNSTGTSGYSGTTGATGYSGYSGQVGSTGISGYSGAAGTSGYSGTSVINSGINWTLQSTFDPSLGNWLDVCYGNGLFVAVSTLGNVMISPDGINWTLTFATGSNGAKICYGNGLFVYTTSAPISTVRLRTSPDGVTWTAQASPKTYSLYNICYGNGKFVSITFANENNDGVITSPDGVTWTAQSFVNDCSFADICYGNGMFVAVGNTNTANSFASSPDGITWTERANPGVKGWYRVCYGNGKFVAISIDGGAYRTATSPDGITWTISPVAVPAENYWRGICYGQGLFVAIASSGTGNRVMTSPDGINWTLRVSPADNSWSGICYGNGMFVAVSQSGLGNKVMTSGVPTKYDLPLNNKYNGGMEVTGDSLLDGEVYLNKQTEEGFLLVDINHKVYVSASGYSGYLGLSGYSGTSGWSGMAGAASASGYSGLNGSSGYSGMSGQNLSLSGLTNTYLTKYNSGSGLLDDSLFHQNGTSGIGISGRLDMDGGIWTTGGLIAQSTVDCYSLETTATGEIGTNLIVTNDATVSGSLNCDDVNRRLFITGHSIQDGAAASGAGVLIGYGVASEATYTNAGYIDCYNGGYTPLLLSGSLINILNGDFYIQGLSAGNLSIDSSHKVYSSGVTNVWQDHPLSDVNLNYGWVSASGRISYKFLDEKTLLMDFLISGESATSSVYILIPGSRTVKTGTYCSSTCLSAVATSWQISQIYASGDTVTIYYGISGIFSDEGVKAVKGQVILYLE